MRSLLAADEPRQSTAPFCQSAPARLFRRRGFGLTAALCAGRSERYSYYCSLLAEIEKSNSNLACQSKSVKMNSKMNPDHLLSELCWLADFDNFFDEWINSSEEIRNNSAEEFYNTIFDDYLILEAREIYMLSEDMAYYVFNVALFLQKASPGHEEIDARKLVKDPDFIIAQKICQIIKELCMGSG